MWCCCSNMYIYMLCVIHSFNILRLYIFCDGNVSKYCLKCVLDVHMFVVNKLPNDSTLVLKHLELGTRYEVCFVIYFIVF